MNREKFQQKAPQQTKQKKSKSAEFLMVKGEREVQEGTENLAFCTSMSDLSTHWLSEKKMMGRIVGDHSLAPHPQESRLPTTAKLKDKHLVKTPHSEEPTESRKSPELSGEDKAGSAYSKGSVRCAQKATALPGWSSSQQNLKSEGEEPSQCIPMSSLKTGKRSEKAWQHPCTTVPQVCVEEGMAMWGSLADVTKEGETMAETIGKVQRSSLPQCFCIQVECIRGLKNKAPQGFYILRIALLECPGGRVLHLGQSDYLKTKTHPVKHNGNFYDVGLYFHENLCMALPSKKDVKPGMAFLFELVLLCGKGTCHEQVVGWSAFPLCDDNFDVVEGKFKCPLLRGHYDQKLDNFRKIEDLICLNLDHWLCNLYFQVIKLPLGSDDQDGKKDTGIRSKCQVFLIPEQESNVDDVAGLSVKQTEKSTCTWKDDEAQTSSHFSQGSDSHRIGPCPIDCDPSRLKGDHKLHNKGEDLTGSSVKKKSKGQKTVEIEDFSQDLSYLEELEKHRYSVYCSSVTHTGRSREFFKHLHFALTSIYVELELSHWRSQGFWYIILLVAAIWFLRLYLHYLGQWLFLWTISVPVTKLHFSLHTVELCYPASSLHMGQELFVVAAGPLALNALLLLCVLVRWGCQMLSACCPDVLSKLIITTALWTVLDPLAVFLVDTILGRLMLDEEKPTADAAKLYWLFVRTMQPGILGVMITVILYILLFIISSLVLYLYCLRLSLSQNVESREPSSPIKLNSNSRISDAFQRIYSEEAKFFIPYDLEISNQELSYIVKRAEQWRGINSERRKVAVYDYIWKSHGVESSVSCCDLEHPSEIPVPALGPGDVTSHVSIYTIYPSGFQELYRHFLRLPSGAIVEVFGDVSGLKLVHSDVVTAIQEHLEEMDCRLEDSFGAKSRQRRSSSEI